VLHTKNTTDGTGIITVDVRIRRKIQRV
jgi:hypothetical protein